jgi:hypothetical protein
MRLSLYSVVAVLIAFAMAYKVQPTRRANPLVPSVATMMTEGAYRDGLYLGRLHRKQGLPSHPAVGRWSRQSDRQLFATGYSRGYTGISE